MIYFTADWHLGHNNVLEFDKKRWEKFYNIDDHDLWIISQIASLSSKDEVYFLWDLAWKFSEHHQSWVFEYMDKIKCKMHWILWNHDYKALIKKYWGYFETINHYHELKYNKRKFILTHYPFETWWWMYRSIPTIHLHWHTHQKELRTKPPSRLCVSYNWGKLLWSVDEVLELIPLYDTSNSEERA